MCQSFVCLRQVLFVIRRVASFHLGAENSRQLLTDKFNLHLQYCMSGLSACLLRAVGVFSTEHGPFLVPSLRTQDGEEFSHSAFLRLDRTLYLWLP